MKSILVDISDIQFGYSGIVHDLLLNIKILQSIENVTIKFIYVDYFKVFPNDNQEIIKKIEDFHSKNGIKCCEVQIYHRNYFISKFLDLFAIPIDYIQLAENQYLFHNQFRIFKTTNPKHHLVRLYDFIAITNNELISKPTYNKFKSLAFISKLINYKTIFLSDSETTIDYLKLIKPEKKFESKILYCPVENRIISDDINNKPKFKYLLHVSSIEPKKNQIFLVNVFKKVKEIDRFSDLKLVIVGNVGWNADPITNQIKSHQDIIWVQKADDETRNMYYQYADCFIFPSIVEGFGMPPIEAMSFGIPVLSSDIPIHREIQGEAAFYANLNNIDDFVEKIIYVLDKQNQNEVCSKIKYSKKWINRYSSESIKKTWEKILDI